MHQRGAGCDKEMTMIRVGMREGKSKIVEIDKPFGEIRSADVMSMVNGAIAGWVNVEVLEMDKHCAVKKCCLICDHAVVEDIDDMDYLIPCNNPENMVEHGGSPCMEQDHVCEYFELNSILAPRD